MRRKVALSPWKEGTPELCSGVVAAGSAVMVKLAQHGVCVGQRLVALGVSPRSRVHEHALNVLVGQALPLQFPADGIGHIQSRLLLRCRRKSSPAPRSRAATASRPVVRQPNGRRQLQPRSPKRLPRLTSRTLCGMRDERQAVPAADNWPLLDRGECRKTSGDLATATYHSHGNRTTRHCGGGWGRTGSIGLHCPNERSHARASLSNKTIWTGGH